MRESHVSELDRRWRRLQNDPTMYSYLPRTEAEDLFDYWNDYKAYYFAASDLYKSLNNTVRSLKPQFSSYYYPSDFERLFEGLFASEQAKEEWKLFDLEYVHQRGLCQSRFKTSCYYGNYENAVKDIKEMRLSIHRTWSTHRREIASVFEQIHDKCKKTHINLCSLYEQGYLQFTKGNFYTAAQSIKKLINYSKDLNNQFLHISLMVNYLRHTILDAIILRKSLHRVMKWFSGDMKFSIKKRVMEGNPAIFRHPGYAALEPLFQSAHQFGQLFSGVPCVG